MNTFFYYKSIRKTTIQFLNVFNDIKVGKFDKDKEIIEYNKVPIKIASKEKFWHWIHERKYEKRLPAIAVNLVGCNYDPDRTIDTTQIFSQKTSSITQDEVNQFFAPVPYNLNYQLTIGSLFMGEMDQILEQILPWFTPNIEITLYFPEIDASYNVKVVLDNASPDYDTNIAEDDYRILNWTLDFTVKTYLLKPVRDTKIIKKINANLYSNNLTYPPSGDGNPDSSGYMETIQTSGYKTEDGDIISKYEILTEIPDG